MESDRKRKELLFLCSMLKEKAHAIISECNKWEKTPGAVFTRGHVHEKVNAMADILETGRKVDIKWKD